MNLSSIQSRFTLLLLAFFLLVIVSVGATFWSLENQKRDIEIVMLTVRDEEEKLFEAIKNGAQGYLLKNIHSKALLEGLRGAMHGEAAISPILAGRMLEEFRRLSQHEPRAAIPEEMSMLTLREVDVLGLVAQGCSDKEIAAQLSISLHTVKSHLRNILAKLQVNSRREAAWLARNKGLL